MDIDRIKKVLCCPKCKATLDIITLENCSFKCNGCNEIYKILKLASFMTTIR